MANDSRLQKSAKNMASGITYRALTMLTAFVVRSVFLYYLNTDYLSINGLYSSVLSMLSLAELGFGTAMVYSMYKPLAEKDYLKLRQLMQLYRKVYTIIGTVILALGLCLVPFLDVIIKEKPDIDGLIFYYLLFLMNSVLSYWFFAYRISILQADQKAYIVSNYQSAFNLIKSFAQIAVLVAFHNFTVYLLTQIGCTIVQNIAIAVRVEKDYPLFDKGKTEKLPANETKKIFRNVKALMLQKVSFQVLNTSDSIIISAFVGINWVGFLSNYLMIEEAVVAVLSQITGAITASLGNYFAVENKESGYKLFRRIEFMSYWLYAFSSVALITLLNPFVTLWLGDRYVLSYAIVISLVLRFFVEGYMNIMSAFRSTLGLFTQGQYLPLCVAGLNILFSIALSYPFGTAGVLIATPLARICINVWYMPLLIHHEGFNKPVASFYADYILRLILLAGVTSGMLLISHLIFANGITLVAFIAMVAITAVLPNLVFALILHRRGEFKYFYDIIKDEVVGKLVRRN